MEDNKILAMLILLRVRDISIEKYFEHLAQVAQHSQIMDVEFLKILQKRQIRRFSDFKVHFTAFFKKNWNDETYLFSDIAADLKTEVWKMKPLSTEAIIEQLDESIQHFLYVKLANDLANKEPAEGLKNLDERLAVIKRVTESQNSMLMDRLDLGDEQAVAKFEEQQRELEKTKRHFVIPTRLPTLNKFMSGGMGSRRFGLIFALPKRFKTTLMLNFAVDAFAQGYNIAFFSLENKVVDSKEVISKIVDIGKLHKLKKEKGFKNYFDVMYYEPGTLSVADMRHYMEVREKQNNLPHLVVLDYIKLLASPFHQGMGKIDMRHIINHHCYQLRALVNRFEIFLWTVGQANRSATKQRKAGIEHIGEDFSQIAGVDYAMSSSVSPMQRAAGLLSLFMLEGRWTDWTGQKSEIILQKRPGSLRFKEFNKSVEGAEK